MSTRGSVDTGERTSSGHGWSELDPLIKFGVALAGLLFLGVIVEGALLVPYALITNGWVAGR
jgi:hypothetical protein